MTQLELLNPIARRTDPVSSHVAAAAITKSGKRMSQRNMVLALVETYPGRTALELAGISVNLDRYQVARRLADLEHSELVRKGEARECVVGQSLAVTWFA